MECSSQNMSRRVKSLSGLGLQAVMARAKERRLESVASRPERRAMEETRDKTEADVSGPQAQVRGADEEEREGAEGEEKGGLVGSKMADAKMRSSSNSSTSCIRGDVKEEALGMVRWQPHGWWRKTSQLQRRDAGEESAAREHQVVEEWRGKAGRGMDTHNYCWPTLKNGGFSQPQGKGTSDNTSMCFPFFFPRFRCTDAHGVICMYAHDMMCTYAHDVMFEHAKRRRVQIQSSRGISLHVPSPPSDPTPE